MRLHALSLMLCVLPLAVSAQVYTCTDSKGRFISSDRLVPECSNREVRVLDRQGVVVQVIPPTSAPTGKPQKNQGNQAEQDRQREDQAMLMRYRSENEIEAARKQDLDRVAGQARNAQAGLDQARQQLKRVQDDAKSGKNNAAVAGKEIRDAQFAVRQQQQLVDRAAAEQKSINARYDAMVKRFRILKANPEKMAPVVESDSDSDQE